MFPYLGTIPSWLQGTLLRNGPGLTKVGDTNYKHVFDGLALIHKFRVENGQISYQSKFLRSDSYTKNMAANRIVVNEFGTSAYPDPCQSIWKRFMSYFTISITDNDNINIYPIGDE